jgi:HAD superfamily hydrolase (TIGR01509 family)
MTKKALIFDFDGIITDTEPIHMEAWLAVLEPYGVVFNEDEAKANYVGLNDRDFLTAISRIHGVHFNENERNDLIQDKGVATLNLLEHDIPLISGVDDFIDKVSERYLLAICSGAQRGEIDFILKHLKWSGRFAPIVSSENVSKGKPDPEGYIRALEGLQARTDENLVAADVVAIEDSPKGIEAARLAGLKCIAVTNSFPVSELGNANIIVADLNELSFQDIDCI